MAKFKRFSKTLEKAPGKRVVSITVKPTATNCTGRVWFTDLCLQEGNALTGYHPHTEIFLKKLREGGKIKPPVWFNGVVRSEETVVLFNGGTTSAPLDVHIYPKADMKAGSIALCQGVGGQKALFPNAIEKDADLALLAEARSCTKDGEPEPKEGFYQYSAAWDSKHKVTLEDRKSARVLFSMQEMEGYVMPILEAEPEFVFDETKIAIIKLDKNGAPTWDVSYFLTFADASSYLADNAKANYDMRVGDKVEISSIPNMTFQDRTNLRHVTLNDKVFTIGEYAFQRCAALLEVYAPAVTLIRQYGFAYCTSLTDIAMPNIMSIQGSCFIHCESLDNVSIKTLRSTIPAWGFAYCYNLKAIELSPFLPAILGYGFYGCKSLTQISLPNSLQAIQSNAFTDCKSLEEIELPGMLTEIGENTFSNCDNLVSVSVTSPLKVIKNSAFYKCRNLASISLPDTLQTIQSYAFSYCESLAEISLPSALQTIQTYAFRECGSLETITIAKPQNSISGAPWGAPNAAVIWTG